MLALTESAVQAVRDIVSTSEAASETGGLRFVAEPGASQTHLELSVVALPSEDDEVVEEGGARLFLDPEAAELLDDKVLDANVNEDQVAFVLKDQT